MLGCPVSLLGETRYVESWEVNHCRTWSDDDVHQVAWPWGFLSCPPRLFSHVMSTNLAPGFSVRLLLLWCPGLLLCYSLELGTVGSRPPTTTPIHTVHSYTQTHTRHTADHVTHSHGCTVMHESYWFYCCCCCCCCCHHFLLFVFWSGPVSPTNPIILWMKKKGKDKL